MGNELQQLYEKENRLKYYFDKTVPVDLYRGQNVKEEKKGIPIIYPNPGFIRGDGSVRLPDVLIEVIDGIEMVRGCLTIRGDYRGVSVFDKKTPMHGFKWYKLPAGTAIPGALAITQDDAHPSRPNHYTIAPKNNMPLALFNICLQELIQKLALVE